MISNRLLRSTERTKNGRERSSSQCKSKGLNCMTSRYLSEGEYHALKAAFRSLLKAAGGPARASEEITRMDPARLSRYGNLNELMFAPVDVVADLEAEVGHPIVTKILAEMAGFNLVPKAEASKQGVDFNRHIGELAKETGDVLVGLGSALPDGVSADEARNLLTQVREAQERLANLEDDLKTVAGNVTHGRRHLQAVEG